MTATLSLNYRAPTRADQVRSCPEPTPRGDLPFVQFVVVKTRLEDLKGRKATVSGRVEDLQGTLLVDATYALFTFLQIISLED